MMYPKTKYFRTFTAESHPIEPREEIAKVDICGLTTYYEAQYDADERLREFRKQLLQRDSTGSKSWTTAFIERYDYWPSGRLKLRRLVGPDGTMRTWNFDDVQFRWTTFLSQWFEKWLSHSNSNSDKSSTNIPNLAERTCACHELINEMESSLLRSAGSVRDIDWAFREITASVPIFKDFYEILLGGSRPRVSFLTSTGGPLRKSLSGFDEFLNLGCLTEVWNVLAERAETTPLEIFTATGLDSTAQEWLKANEIRVAYAVPIRVFRAENPGEDVRSQSNLHDSTTSENKPELTLAELVLWLRVAPSHCEEAGIVSIFRRQGLFTRFVMQMVPDVQSIWVETRGDVSPHF